jgi:hypothetical protein
MTRCLTPVRARLLLAVATVATLVIAAHGAPAWLGGVVAYLLPPVLLLGALARRRYPGERMLLAFVVRKRRRLRPGRSPAPGRRSRPRVLVPRGGRLIASSLAVRPPPAFAASLTE